MSNVVVYPGTFENAGLPRVSVTEGLYREYIVHDFDADTISGTIGSAARGHWVSKTSEARLGIETGTTLRESNGHQYLSLDGVTARVRGAFTMSAPFTIVAVMAMRSPKDADQPIYPYASGGEGFLSVVGDKYAYRDAQNIIASSSAVVPGKTEVITVGNRGETSFLHDSSGVYYGKISGTTLGGLTLGFANGNKRSAVDFYRVIVYGVALPKAARERIASTLKQEYGLS